MAGGKARCQSRRGWRKLHLALNADSGDIIAHVMTDQDAGDASQVQPLLDQIDTLTGQITADGAHDGELTYDAITYHSSGAAVIMPPRANALERTDSDCQVNETDTLRRSTPMATWSGRPRPATGNDLRLRRRSVPTNRSSDGGFGHIHSQRSRRKSPSAALSSIACWLERAQNPSAAKQLRRSQGIKDENLSEPRPLHQRPPQLLRPSRQ
jgi:Transposase DDE domain